MKNPRKLNLRQKLFCDWYIKLGGNGSQAAIKAGYSKSGSRVAACELLTKPNISAYMEKRKKEFEDLLGINKTTVLQDLLDIKKKSMQAVPVMEYDRSEREMVQTTAINDKGEEVGVFEYDSLGAIKALETVNKMLGYYEPEKVEDVTPLEKKPSTVVINKTYVNQEPDRPTT